MLESRTVTIGEGQRKNEGTQGTGASLPTVHESEGKKHVSDDRF